MKISLSGTAGSWTDHAKNSLFAPELASLSVCGAKPLESPAEARLQWLSNFILNTTFRHRLPEPDLQLSFALLRRVDQAAEMYEAARIELTTYLNVDPPTRLTRYSRSLAQFEACVAATCHAWSLVREILPDRPKLFERGDGTDAQRLWELYNSSKHLDERISVGQAAPNSTLHIWLTNAGLKSTLTEVSFEELRGLIESLCRIAQAISDGPRAS